MKIKLFIFSICLVFISCAKEENYVNNIPNAQVEIDIQTQLQNKFDNAYHNEKFDSGVKTGYAGVVVISDQDSNIYAYDLCCPYEAPEKNKIEIPEGSPTGKCTKCKSVFYVADQYGKAVSGPCPSNMPMKRYRVNKDDKYYRIRN